jgi:hypothetical protein
MMLTPWGPSAVPTGGAGVALPAASCNLIVVCIFFGGMFLYPKFLSFLPDSIRRSLRRKNLRREKSR